MINQQLAAAKTLGNPVQRIAVMLRGADLLWLHEREKSRSTFAEAFELAKETYKTQGDAPTRAGRGLLMETPDQRFVVIRAVARRDPRWASKLLDELLKEDSLPSNDSRSSQATFDERTPEKLLRTAMSLLPQDMNAAMGFADASLRFSAGYSLTPFLYKLSEADQSAADEFYRRALVVYGAKPLREFLYLAAYPFGLNTTGDMPVIGSYTVPGTFRPNSTLQLLFARTLIGRAQGSLEAGVAERDNYNGLSGVGHIVQAITMVEPQVSKQFPDLASQLVQTRSQLLNSLPAETQAALSRTEDADQNADDRTFEERLEEIEKQANADKRDELLVHLILHGGSSESLENITRATAKISDTTIRSQVLDWVYFNRAQRALKDKSFDEASKAASRVQEMDQRAYLYSEIAKAIILQPESQIIVRDLLEQIVGTAEKAPTTIVTARALLAAANLYLKFDPDRAVSVLATAIKTTNQLESPDFGPQLVMRKIEGRNFATYAAYKTASFDPESAFREMAKIDYDSAIVQSSAISDKALRAHIAYALADFCLAKPKLK